MEVADAGRAVVFFGYIALFLGKPIWYSLILAFASKRLAPFGPHWPPPHAEDASPAAMKTRERYTFIAGGVARAALGWTFIIIRSTLGQGGYAPGHSDKWLPNEWNDAIFLWIGVYGFILWCLVGKAVFRRAPLWSVIAFAALAEIVSLVVDIPAVHASRINIC